MLSIPHIAIIFLVALIVLGPDKLPPMARALGKVMADFRRVTGDFRYQMESEMNEMERQTRLKEQTANSIAASALPGGIPEPTLAPYEPPAESGHETAVTPSEQHPGESTNAESVKETAPADTPKPSDGQSRTT